MFAYLYDIVISHSRRCLRSFISLLIMIQPFVIQAQAEGKTFGASGVLEENKDQYDHYVVLSVISVDWQNFDEHGGGWSSAIEIKENEFVKYYEATIWEDLNSVHLYAFDNYYDSLVGLGGQIPMEDAVNQRESYVIKRFSDIPPDDWEGEYLADAFIEFFKIIYARHPNSGIGLIYEGHGSGGGGLLANSISSYEARRMLNGATTLWGRKLDWLDLGGPCNEGQLNPLTNFAPFFRYIIASDLPNGGYLIDSLAEDAPPDWTRMDLQIQGHRAFTEEESKTLNALRSDVISLGLNANSNLLEVLKRGQDNKRGLYELSKNDMSLNVRENLRADDVIEQANYIYDSAAFVDFSHAFQLALKDDRNRAEGSRANLLADNDVLTLVQNLGDAELVRLYDEVFLHKIDNRDFFEWPGPSLNKHPSVNGMGCGGDCSNILIEVMLLKVVRCGRIFPTLLITQIPTSRWLFRVHQSGWRLFPSQDTNLQNGLEM